MPDDKKKFIPTPKADAWRLDVSPLAYNYDNYLNSLGYRAGISSKNFLHKPSPGGLYYPMSLNFSQSYADNSRAYNADPSKFENPQEVIAHQTFGQPTTYEDFTRGAREADMGVDFKVGATNMNPSPKWSGAYGAMDLGVGYSKLRQGYGSVEAGGGYKFPTNNGFSGSAGAHLKTIVQNKDLYGTLQDRVIPGKEGFTQGNAGQNKFTWGYGLKGDFNYSHPHDHWTVGARGSVMADMTQGKNNYRFANAADSNRVEITPVVNAELYAQYPLNYGINKIQNKLAQAKKNDIIPPEKGTPKLGGFSAPNLQDSRPNEFHVKPVSFGMGQEYPTMYEGDNGTHSLFGNIEMPDKQFKNGGQFDRKFNLPEDSFRQGGNHLHDSIYSSSLEQYPAVYAMGGFLGNPNVNLYNGGGDLNVPTPQNMANLTVAERTALIYQAVSQYVNQAKADGRLGPEDNLNIDGVVAQILLETGNGTSSLVKRANNFGGIKADNKWKGPRTGEYRLYSTPEEGLKAQIDFYIDNARYRKNGVFAATTPEEHLAAVKRAGYATAPNYVSAGMSMVKSIKPRLAKVDMSKFNIPASALTNEPTAIVEAPPISEEEIAQGMQPINRLGIRPLQPLNILPDINTAPEIVPYTTGASAQNQMPNLTSEAPSIPKGWFGGNNGLFGGNRQKKFAQGGLMNQLTEFNEGGSHEENPLGGIPQGMNQNGGMNLVQEGETKNNAQDFIYSDDITISKGIAKQFNINSRFVGKTYADASKKANRTDSRRETDTIEQNAIAKDLDKLAQAQEAQKQEELQKDMAKMAEKHPEFMAQMMQAQQQPPMGQPSPEEMAMMQQQGQMDPAMQDPGMDPAMMQMPQGMTYGGPMSYKCGGNMYDFGGYMKENDDAFTQAGAGALKGAGTGASIGSVVPGIGTAIGAAAGAVIGGVVGGIKGNKQDKAEHQAKIDAANRERLTGIQTEIPQEASNHTLEVLGQAALQGGSSALGAMNTGGTPTSGGGAPVMDNTGNQMVGTGDAYSWNSGNMPTMPSNMANAGMQGSSYQGFRTGGYMHNAGPMGQPLTNLYPWGGGLNPSNIDYGQFNSSLGNPYAAVQGENTLPSSFNYNSGMNPLPDDFGNYQPPAPAQENYTPTAEFPSMYLGNTPLVNNKTPETKKEEQNKNQFSDFKTDQDAAKDKFSMNETLGQFVGSNLGAGYNLYQGLFGKKLKVPSSKDMFTAVDPYRMNINPQLRAAEESYAGAARGIMNAAPSGGAYLTNRAMLAASEAATRAGIMAQAENAYGASKMQTDMFNSQGKSQSKLKEFELKSAIDAAKQNYLQAGLQGINESTNAQKANQAALIYANMHGGGEYTAEANPYLQQLAMEYQQRREAKKAQK